MRRVTGVAALRPAAARLQKRLKNLIFEFVDAGVHERVHEPFPRRGMVPSPTGITGPPRGAFTLVLGPDSIYQISL